MSHPSPEWEEEITASDVTLIETAPGGTLSETARRSAVESSLSLLGVYFAQGSHELIDVSAASRSRTPDGLDALLAGLRLRVAISAGHRLIALTESIVRRPTFRYQLQSGQEVGSLSNALDINRWVTQPRGNEDLSFPVLTVERGLRTPENVLLVFALEWLLRELTDSFNKSVATIDVVEYQAVRHLKDRLSRFKRLPALAECMRSASGIRTAVAAKRLVSEVQRRLQRREITNEHPYGELASWISECLQGKPAVPPGDIDLSVYGDRFDSKLFELWCLGALSRGIATALNLPQPSVDPAWRGRMPAYRFDTFSGSIELYFQRGLRSISAEHVAHWSREDGRLLGGIPDIIAKTEPTRGDSRLAIIDPKLRQRDRLPADELYKILGYLENFEIRPAIGIVVIYTTSISDTVPNVFHDSQGGTLISVALNPSAPPSMTDKALYVVVRTILRLIDYDVPATLNPAHTENGDDDQTEQSIEQIRRSLLAWGSAHLGDIASSRERMESLVGSERWNSLDDDVQVMMATADLVGHNLDRIADFSGPAIGMCAAVEHIIHARILSPAIGNNAAWQRQIRTLGAGIDAIEAACRSQGNYLHRAIIQHIVGSGITPNDVLALIDPWRRLNRDYRVPAAHRQVLSKTSWQQLYRLLFGPDSLFIETFDTLCHLQLAKRRASTCRYSFRRLVVIAGQSVRRLLAEWISVLLPYHPDSARPARPHRRFPRPADLRTALAQIDGRSGTTKLSQVKSKRVNSDVLGAHRFVTLNPDQGTLSPWHMSARPRSMA